MTKTIFTNILGCFVIDDNKGIIEQKLFADYAAYSQREDVEKAFRAKHPKALPFPEENFPTILALFADQRYFSLFHERNIELTKAALKAAVSDDDFIFQTISTLKDLDKICNMLAKRLREWYDLYAPEVVRGIESHAQFVAAVLERQKSADSFGADLAETDVAEMQELARKIQGLSALQEQQEAYLESVMKKHCPNLLAVAGAKIGAQLLDHAKGLKRLALLPASTIQLLGAEKALFRHMTTGSRSPKYGLLYQHPLVQKARPSERGKVARMLADKLSLCARLDFFKGGLHGKEYLQELEKKLAANTLQKQKKKRVPKP
ncbi:MAG: NOP5/NOP56 family protein [Nanoarchaeota archaeon]|nr:NOP5/NOP56 family protein [Nanoarchaeota archaeon]